MKKRKLEVAVIEENVEERRGVGLRSLMIWWLWISLNVGGELSMAARIICRLLLQCEVASLTERYDWIVE